MVALIILTLVLLIVFIKDNFEPFDYRPIILELEDYWYEVGDILYEYPKPDIPLFWRVMNFITFGYIRRKLGYLIVEKQGKRMTTIEDTTVQVTKYMLIPVAEQH